MKQFKRSTALLLTLLVFLTGTARAQVDDRVQAGAPTFGYYAPELHELHLRVPVQIRAIGGEEKFRPNGVFINGQPVRYAYWYFNGTTHDYADMPHAGGQKVEVFAAYPWRAGEQYSVRLAYTYGDKEGEQTTAARAPLTGGVWAQSDGANYGFLIREEAGIARRNEPVELDLTVPARLFPKPQETVRAAIMTRPGVFEEIPAQVYGVDYSAAKTDDGAARFVRFRTTVQLSIEPKKEVLVFLWNSAAPRAVSTAGAAINFTGGALGGSVENEFYKIDLDAESGQMMAWRDKRLDFTFDWMENRENPPRRLAMQYTPDVYRAGSPWSHSSDWKKPEAHELRGPVFAETLRLGPMPGAPELASRVTYRFFAKRPEVRVSSVMRVVKDVDVLAFRNGGMIQTGTSFTHAAWPRQDGSINRVPIASLLGNDTGSPSVGRMPWTTPWVAFYDVRSGRALALMTTNLSVFNEGQYSPNMSNAMYYVSFYRGAFLYTIRALNINYSANIRSYLSPMRAGTVTSEEFTLLPFTFKGENQNQFQPVENLRRELLNPLIVVP